MYRSKQKKIVKIPRNYFSQLKSKIDLKDNSGDPDDDSGEDQSRLDSIVFVLANLSVRQDKRKRGIARSLLDACDAECKVVNLLYCTVCMYVVLYVVYLYDIYVPYVCMYICSSMFMIFTYCMCVCVYVCMYSIVYLCVLYVYVCMYSIVYLCVLYVYVCMCSIFTYCMYVHVCVCVCVYTCSNVYVCMDYCTYLPVTNSSY